MFKVLGPRVFISRIDAPAVKSALIEVVQMDPEPSPFGVVLAVGDSQEGLKVGDTVLVKQYSGAPFTVKIRNKEVEGWMVQEDDILATVEL